MSMTDELDAVRDSINSGAIADLPAKRLEEFSVILCRSQAFAHFGASQFPQICETVRTHLVRAHIETLQNHVAELHNHITKLNESNTKLSRFVVALTIAALVAASVQTIVTILPYAGIFPKQSTASTQQAPASQSAAPIQPAAPSSGQAKKKTPAS